MMSLGINIELSDCRWCWYAYDCFAHRDYYLFSIAVRIVWGMIHAYFQASVVVVHISILSLLLLVVLKCQVRAYHTTTYKVAAAMLAEGCRPSTSYNWLAGSTNLVT